MIKMTSRESILFTIEKADWVLNQKEIAGDRPLRNGWVKELQEAMVRGTFQWELVNLSVCKLKDEIYRVNGQHTCWARTNLGSKIQSQSVGLLRYEVDTMDELCQLYASTDRGAPRTKANVIQSYLNGSQLFENIPVRDIKVIADGYCFFMRNGKDARNVYDGDSVARSILSEGKVLTKTLLDYLYADGNGGTFSAQRHIRRAPVMGGLFATFAKSRSEAPNFWTPVRTGVGIESQNDPRLKLRTALMETSITDNKGESAPKRTATQEEMARWVIYAWNAWRENRKLNGFRVPMNIDRPKLV